MDPARTIVQRFLEAVEGRDVDALVACFTVGGTWQNVPHDPAIGREGIRAMFTPIIARSTDVTWDIVTAHYLDTRAWLERVDRFWIDGVEYAVRCNGVFEVDPPSGLIAEVRDYVDLAEWRSRLIDARL